MKRYFTGWLLALIAGGACAQRPAYGGKLKPEQANMDIRHYTIDLALDIPGQSISGYTIIGLRLKEPASALLFDLMDSFTVSKVTVDDKPAGFTHTNHELHITTTGSCIAAGR